MTRGSIFEEINKERTRQDEKHGWQDTHGRHLNEWWLAILMEEIGEVSEEMLDLHFQGKKDEADLRDEVLQAAAVAIAWVESIDRRINEI
ncbi:hypothetical protein LCGC14_0593200 [marine sediment metagenome]|uniref:NTP pyrophosphohydrolase MazG putative catalytic core domain-containing protein n=1 Tax=marine sediment metagenome TaxID=412755 RepID=A0A0F9RWK5_9ZZZZ